MEKEVLSPSVMAKKFIVRIVCYSILFGLIGGVIQYALGFSDNSLLSSLSTSVFGLLASIVAVYTLFNKQTISKDNLSKFLISIISIIVEFDIVVLIIFLIFGGSLSASSTVESGSTFLELAISEILNYLSVIYIIYKANKEAK